MSGDMGRVRAGNRIVAGLLVCLGEMSAVGTKAVAMAMVMCGGCSCSCRCSRWRTGVVLSRRRRAMLRCRRSKRAVASSPFPVPLHCCWRPLPPRAHSFLLCLRAANESSIRPTCHQPSPSSTPPAPPNTHTLALTLTLTLTLPRRPARRRPPATADV